MTGEFLATTDRPSKSGLSNPFCAWAETSRLLSNSQIDNEWAPRLLKEWAAENGGNLDRDTAAHYINSEYDSEVEEETGTEKETETKETPDDGKDSEPLRNTVKEAFAPLRLKAVKTTTSFVKLKWRKIKGAVRYEIYGARSGKKYKLQQLMTTKKTVKKIGTLDGKNLKKASWYQFRVIALDKNGHELARSKIVHAVTAGGKRGNYTRVVINTNQKKVVIKKGHTYKLRAKAIRASGKKVKRWRRLCYESGNPAVARISSKGVITGVSKGTCYVYVSAQNGIYVKCKVTVV